MASAALRCGLCQSCVGSLRRANTFILINYLTGVYTVFFFFFFQYSICLRFYLKPNKCCMSQSDFVFHYSGWFWWVQQFLLCSPAVLECGRWKEVQPTFPWRPVRHTWIHSTHQPLHMNQTSLLLLGTSVLFGRTTSLQFLQELVFIKISQQLFLF